MGVLCNACRSLLPWLAPDAPTSPRPRQRPLGRPLHLELLEDRPPRSLAAVAAPHLTPSGGPGVGDALAAPETVTASPVSGTVIAMVRAPLTWSRPLAYTLATPLSGSRPLLSAAAAPGPAVRAGPGMGGPLGAAVSVSIPPVNWATVATAQALLTGSLIVTTFQVDSNHFTEVVGTVLFPDGTPLTFSASVQDVFIPPDGLQLILGPLHLDNLSAGVIRSRVNRLHEDSGS